jgi:hypothetical protein
MANDLKTQKRQQAVALQDLGWSYRRIESETGVGQTDGVEDRRRAARKSGQSDRRLRGIRGAAIGGFAAVAELSH